MPIPISRYFEIPIPNTEPTFKNTEKYRKTDTDFKYRHRPKTTAYMTLPYADETCIPCARDLYMAIRFRLPFAYGLYVPYR